MDLPMYRMKIPSTNNIFSTKAQHYASYLKQNDSQSNFRSRMLQYGKETRTKNLFSGQSIPVKPLSRQFSSKTNNNVLPSLGIKNNQATGFSQVAIETKRVEEDLKDKYFSFSKQPSKINEEKNITYNHFLNKVEANTNILIDNDQVRNYVSNYQRFSKEESENLQNNKKEERNSTLRRKPSIKFTESNNNYSSSNLVSNKKLTCMSGLSNLGNTCYM